MSSTSWSTASLTSSESLSYALSPTRCSGFSPATKHLETVASARVVTSCGEADDATYTETGRPVLYLILLPWASYLCPAWSFQFRSPSFFSHYESTIDKAFRQVNPSTIMQVSGQCLEYLLKYSSTHPLLEPSMTCLVRWVPFFWHVMPWSTSTEDPQDAVHNVTSIFPWSTSTIRAPWRVRD